MKKIYFVTVAIFAFIYIISEVRKKKFSIRESFWWVIASIIMIFLALFPYSIDKLAAFFQVAYGPSLLFVFSIVFLVFINFRNSKRIAEQNEKIIELAQELAILKSKERK